MAQSGSGSSRTPFDNDLVNDPQAPRDTQPLTSGVTPPPHGVQSPSVTPMAAPSSNLPRNFPPQVVTTRQDDDTAVNAAQTGRLTKRLPAGTLVGLALAGGALGVLLLSMIVRSVLPGPTNKIVYTPEGAPPAPPRVEFQPSTGGSGSQVPQRDDFASRSVIIDEEPAIADITVDEAPNTRRSRSTEVNTASRRASSDGSDNVNEGEVSSDNSLSSSTGARSGSSSRNDSEDTGSSYTEEQESSRETSTSRTRIADSRDGASSGFAASGVAARGATSSGERFSSRRGYAITPPAGYKLQRTGRRTVWRGPNGEQILVETGGTSGTPREGWERLDKALSKKYGSKYRNRGIRETTMAGKPAAVWEFEIDTPSGTQRKIDIAVHHNGRGYAVLGQAPAETFEDARPRIEAAIRSFELQRQREAASSTRARPRGDDSSPSGNTSSTRARRSSPTRRTETPTKRSDSAGDSRRDVAPDDAGDDTAPVRSEGY